MKAKRHKKILALITEHEVETQEELQQLLQENGLNVTQATVSRDIKELKLIKTLQDGVYRYVQSVTDTSMSSIKFESIFTEAVVKIDYSGNTIAIKCHTGLANAACAVFDAMEIDNVVGTIAGDDTIFVLMRNENSANLLVKELYLTVLGQVK